MKYNRSEIVKAAWNELRLFRIPYTKANFAICMKRAWYYAKKEAEQEARRDRSHYEVAGLKLWNGSERIIATGIDHDTAARIKWENRCQYDTVEIRKIA